MTKANRTTLMSYAMAGEDMQRDDEMIKAILLELAEYPEESYPFPNTMSQDPVRKKKHYHLLLLCDGGFVEEVGAQGGSFRLRNQGHDLLNAMLSDTIWNRAKDVLAGTVKEASLGTLLAVASELTLHAARKTMGFE